ncbi:hypothetical protein AVEN_178502-1 [Araneus ventricosus]|uniref:Uncharacterized protein n=1 Tax=Araneus ventricosus TaxID=182803 RepID=A0A4Y2CDS3_ARAVE|nr:hypothetical protein AVEN_178502-1 [Araneus ventricosus]
MSRFRQRWVPGSKPDSVDYLVLLMPRFEATRGRFWDVPRNFETRLDDEDNTSAGTTSPKFHTTLGEKRFVPTYDLTSNRPYTRWIFSGIGFRTSDRHLTTRPP